MKKLKPFLLYKINENNDCIFFLQIIQYLFSQGIDCRPENIIDKDFPDKINNIVPSIQIKNKLIIGLPNIIEYFSNNLDINQEKLIENVKKNIDL